ncbi:MAG: hypothetical protein AB1758_20630, partial [Candidatus Eremiobacterota bacterium]
MRRRALALMILLLTALSSPPDLVAGSVPPAAPVKGPGEIFVGVLGYRADAWEPDNSIGWVAYTFFRQLKGMVVEHRGPEADLTEQYLKEALGGTPELDYILQPDSPDQLFEQLGSLTRDGRKVRFLVVAGHGSKDLPRIDLGKVPMDKDSLDREAPRAALTKSLKLNEYENQVLDGGEDVDLAQAKAETCRDGREGPRKRLKSLDAGYDCMADGATILLLNCSAAGSPGGLEMIRRLGETLLGKRGGTILASRKDIQINQAWISGNPINIFRSGSWQSAGDYFVLGDWVRIDVPPQPDPFLFAAFHPTSVTTAEDGSVVTLTVQVDPRPDSGQLRYYWNYAEEPVLTPEFQVEVQDDPKHRMNVPVRVEDAMGRVARDRFTIRVTPSDRKVAIALSSRQPKVGEEITATATLARGTLPSQAVWVWKTSGGVEKLKSKAGQARLKVKAAGQVHALLYSSGDFDRAHLLAQASVSIKPRPGAKVPPSGTTPPTDTGPGASPPSGTTPQGPTDTGPGSSPGTTPQGPTGQPPPGTTPQGPSAGSGPGEDGRTALSPMVPGGTPARLRPLPNWKDLGELLQRSRVSFPDKAGYSGGEVTASFSSWFRGPMSPQELERRVGTGKDAELRPVDAGGWKGLLSVSRSNHPGFSRGQNMRYYHQDVRFEGLIAKGGETYLVVGGIEGAVLEAVDPSDPYPSSGPTYARLDAETEQILREVEAMLCGIPLQPVPPAADSTGPGPAPSPAGTPKPATQPSPTPPGPKPEPEKMAVELSLSPANREVPVGTEVDLTARVTSNGKPAPGPFVFRWQPNTELTFTPQEDAASSSQTILGKPGKTTVWVEVLRREGGALKTLATSQTIELTVGQPSLSLRFTPSNPRVGQPVTARVSLEPDLPT